MGFDDRQAAQISLGELRERLLEEGVRHQFRVNRDGQKTSIDALILLVSVDRS
jgi:hypothetical protein